MFLKVLNKDERTRLVSNISSHLVQADDSVWERVFNNLTMSHPDYGRRVREETNRLYQEKHKVNIRL